MTRFRLPSTWSLLRFYWKYRGVSKRTKDVDGLLDAEFLIGDLHTAFIVSLWQSKEQMDRWIGVDEHVHAVHFSCGKTRETWSARWLLDAVSPSANSWSALSMHEGSGG